MLEPVYRAVSNTAVRKDMWVRIPPAVPPPLTVDFDCVAIPPDVTRCVDRRAFDGAYAYLLGIYLGDGMLSGMPKRLWRLRIFQDERYPAIVDRIRWAAETVSGTRTGVVQKVGCVEIASYSKHWRCVFPQHGPGPKHLRRIALARWQKQLVEAFPHEFVRGLIHSDGCRAINRVRRPTTDGVKEYRYVRYFFSNASPEIRAMFVEACALIGVTARRTTERNLSVAHRDSVAVLETFVGPKA